MSKPPAFQFYASDFLTDVAEFSNEAVGAYIRLLCSQWVNGDLPSDEKSLCRVCHSYPIEFPEIWEEIKHKFSQKKNGRLVNLKMEKVRNERKEFVKKAAKAGKKGAEKRWNKDSEPHKVRHSKPYSENIALQSSSSSMKKEKVYKKEISDKKLFLDRVLLSEKEHETLLRDFGEEIINDQIDSLNDYGGQFPDKFKKYKSHYSTIKNWIRREIKKQKEKANIEMFRHRVRTSPKAELSGIKKSNPITHE